MGPVPGACVYIKIKYDIVLYPKPSFSSCSETGLNQVLKHSQGKNLSMLCVSVNLARLNSLDGASMVRAELAAAWSPPGSVVYVLLRSPASMRVWLHGGCQLVLCELMCKISLRT